MKVLVIGATRNVGLTVIQSLARDGCEVYGCDSRELPFRSYSQYCKSYHRLMQRNPGEFEDRFLSILRKIKPDVCLPVYGAVWVIKNREKIEKLTSLLVPNDEAYQAAFDNARTIQECFRLGIACPKMASEKEVLKSLSNNNRRKEPLRFVIKPRKDVGGARGFYIVQDPDEFLRAKKETEHLFGSTVINEYIPGKVENMRTVNLLFDKDSRLAAAFTTRKLRQWPNRGGITALSISTKEWDLVEMVLPFFQKFCWQGPAEVEIKIDARDQKPKLIEINPRFWSYIGFPVRCGVNFPLLNCYLALGREISCPEFPGYLTDVQYINRFAYLESISEEIVFSQNKLKTLEKIFRELKGKKVTNRIGKRDYRIIWAKFLFELYSKITGKRNGGEWN